MYCRCINNDRIDKSFIVGNTYQYYVNDDYWITVYEPYIMLGFMRPFTIHINDFIMSFQRI